MKVQISLFYQNISSYKFKPLFKCVQVDNNNLNNIFKRSKLLKKKKKTFLNFWK